MNSIRSLRPPGSRRSFRHAAASCVLALASVAGCQTEVATLPAPPQSSTASAPGENQGAGGKVQVDPLADVEVDLAPLPPGDVKTDRWCINRIDGKNVGWSRAVETREQSAAGVRMHTLSDTEFVVARFGQESRQRLAIESIADEQGRMIACRSRLHDGSQRQVTTALVAEKTLTMTIETAGAERTQTLEWSPETLDAGAPERSVAEKPLAPGETRVVRHWAPVINKTTETTLTAEEFEEIFLPGGVSRLLRVQCAQRADDVVQRSTWWCDEQGIARKIRFAGINLETIETSREAALAAATGAAYDLGTATIVPVATDLSSAPGGKRLTIVAKLAESPIDGVFVETTAQCVERLDDHSARLTVIRVRPDEPDAVPPTKRESAAADLSGGPLVQIDDPLVLAFAAEVAVGETDPWSIVVAAERAVRAKIVRRNYSQAFATAADVVRTGEGDCTEHAVLLAAVCRIQGVPTRIAAGLVYSPTDNGFAYHMWNEVWINDRWIPVDATRPQGGVGVDRLLMIATSLDGPDAMAAMLPVLQALGQLSLTVEAVE